MQSNHSTAFVIDGSHTEIQVFPFLLNHAQPRASEKGPSEAPL